MKKRFGLYAAAWAVLFALFNVIAFVTPALPGETKYTASFCIGYVLIDVMFLGQLICAFFAFQETNAKKFFYRVPLLTISYSGLVVSFVFGGLCMLISALPYWVSVIVCAIVLACNVIAIIKAVAVADEVERIDSEVKRQTFFIKMLTVEAETLLAKATDDESKAACKNVYKAVRYSDPMSNDRLAEIENRIREKFAAFYAAVIAKDAQAVVSKEKEILMLIAERNSKCKLLK